MKLIVKHEAFFERLTVWFATTIRLVLNLLVIILIAALIIGIVKAGTDVVHSLHASLEVILQNLLLDAVFILALTEIIITTLGYLKDGRVHVRYIVDTILIIMLNEVVALWFKHPSLSIAVGLSLMLLSLALIRISVTRFAPKDD